MEGEDHKKVHRQRQAGPKAEKKKSKKNHQQDLTPQQRNPRAFSIQHANKTAKIVQRYTIFRTIAITCRLSVNFSHFKLLLRNHWANWNQT